jgi:hypothetical protein
VEEDRVSLVRWLHERSLGGEAGDPDLIVQAIERGQADMMAELLSRREGATAYRVDGPRCVQAMIRHGSAPMLRALLAECPSVLEAVESRPKVRVPCLREGVKIRNRKWRNFYSSGLYRPLNKNEIGVVLRVDAYEGEDEQKLPSSVHAACCLTPLPR